jgi:asparagine synthase (glutamine-hydrolysing)
MIYGFVNLDGRPADPAMLMNMESALADKKHDAQSAFINANVAMGFKNQYITVESHVEALPYFDAETGLYFVCDAIIDNREELAGLLGLRLTNALPDGRIIFEAYKKWGKDCTRYLLGDFAFAVYDSKNRNVQLFRDHVGLRLLYYRREGGSIFFSTLIKPLIDPWGDKRKPELDEKYLVHFLCMNDLRQELYPGSTIYKDIGYVLPACCLSISEQSVTNEVYWDPLDIVPERRLLKTDYVEEFKSIYTNAIRCRLRTRGEVGVMLSGGLDSSSVACVAASILQDQNRALHTYTAVPVEGFKSWAPWYFNADESALVKMMQAAHPNMTTHFIDLKGRNSLTIADHMLDIYEQPYKLIENSFWLDDIYQISSGDGCSVILGGFIGNSTVSSGNFQDILFEHFMKLRWIRFAQDINVYSRCNNIGYKNILNAIKGKFFRSIFLFGKGPFPSGAVKPEYIDKYDVIKNLRSYGVTKKPLLRDKVIRWFFFHPTVLNQAYSMHAKSSLTAGVNARDPTGDKRVIEFCMRLPYDCRFDQATGKDRSLVKRAMTGIVPDAILNERHRGLQAADWLERLEPQWSDFACRFAEELEEPNNLFEYVDIELIKDLVKQNKELTFSFKTGSDVRNIIIIDNCKKFISML